MGEERSASLLDSIGPRALRRAEPRASIAIAAAGCALAVLGVLVVSGDTGTPDDFGEFNKAPGIVLSAVVVGAGYFTLARAGRGAVATGGAVAAALGVPALLFFLTVDVDSFPPYSTEAILYVSTLTWLATFLLGPGRGRPFFLGAGLIGAWASLLQLAEGLFDAPFDAFNAFAATSVQVDDTFVEGGFVGGGSGGPFFDAPDPTTMGLLSLGLGIAYLLLSRRLDRRGYHGTATPCTVAAIPALVISVAFLAGELEAAGSGLLLVAIGVGLAYSGGGTQRRATTWLGGAATAVGLAIFLGDMTDDATIGGMLFLAAGIALVLAAQALAAAIDEPDEMDPTPLAPTPAAAGHTPIPPPPPAPPAPGEGTDRPPPPF